MLKKMFKSIFNQSIESREFKKVNIDLSSCDRCERVWRQCGKHAPCNMQEQVGGGSVMV